jgi:phytanoyl-CoA hydroxylase
MKTATQLTPEQLESYYRDGFIIVEDLVSPEFLEALRNRMREYTHEGRPTDGLSVQVEPRVERGELQVDHPGDGIRKIEKLVEHDDLFQKLALHETIVGIAEQVLGPDLKLFRNALLLKPPSVGSAKGIHQDSPYWPIEPMALCQCWFALDDATPENGCIAVIPGMHKQGALPHKRITDDYVIEEQAYESKKDEMTMAPVPAGGGVFFHSLTPHYTAPNISDHWRRAIAMAYMSSKSNYTGEGESPEYFHVKGKTFSGCVR